ncbi:TPA: DUF975 family protein [Streptococcus agalactiae]
MTNSEIKNEAKTILSNLQGKNQLFLLPILLSIITLYISFYYQYNNMTLLDFFVPLPVYFFYTLSIISVSFVMLDVVKNQKLNVRFSDNTYVFSSHIFWKLLSVLVLKGLILSFFYLLSTFGLLIIISSFRLLLSGNLILAPVLIVVSSLITTKAVIKLVQQYYSYSISTLVFYTQLESGNYEGPSKVLVASRELMNGNKLRLFLLDLSFIGWQFLTIFSFGLVYIYLLPYQTTARLIFYRNITKNS